MTLRDAKYAALQTLTGLSVGTINDMERQWLLIETGESTGYINDLYGIYLTGQGYTTGTVSDRMYAFLGGLGYTGTLNDRLYQFWLDGAIAGAGYLLLEIGDDIVLEDGTGNLLLEA